MNNLDHDDGMMRLPSPDRPSSGYAKAQFSEPAPENTVYHPSLGTYVDADVFALLPTFDRAGVPIHDPITGKPGTSSATEEAGWSEGQTTEEEAPSIEDAVSTPLSSIVTDLESRADSKTQAAVYQALEDNPDVAIGAISQAIGLDHQSAATLMETAVTEAAPKVTEVIGEDAWKALVYAASATLDPFARKIVTDMVRGKLSSGNYARAYALWYESLPDGDDH